MRISDWSSDVCSSDLAVVQHLHRIFAGVDHRPDREEHARTQLGPGAGAAGVDHFGRVVAHLPEPAAAAIADDRIAMAFGLALDRVRDVAHAIAGLRLLAAEPHAFLSDLDQPLRLRSAGPTS